MTSRSGFHCKTTATEVAEAYSDRIKGKTGKPSPHVSSNLV
jgi:hypothetical protein